MLKAMQQLNSELLKYRKIITSMGKKEFQNDYAGSALGLVWGVIKPFMMVFVYWFVFSVGMRQGDIAEDVPYIPWLIAGVFFWTFLSDSLVQGAGAIRNNAHLVKKVVFPVSILPSIRIYTNLLNHLIFMLLAILLMIFQGVSFNLYVLQIIYYLGAGIIFTIGVTRLLSAMAVMSVDILHFIQTIMQVLFWGTPIVWDPLLMSEKSALLAQLVKINPYYYLIQGYRESFFFNIGFWQQPVYTLYFWIITLVIYLLGSYYYTKNRGEFADVL
jgi:ABC-type polysaccharide/polyol phosphate export systems, permease component